MSSYPEYKNINLPSPSKIPIHWDVVPNGYFLREKSVKNTSGEQNLSVYRDYGVIPRDSRDDNHNRVSDDTSNYKLVEVGDFVLNKMKCWMGSLGVSDHRGIVSPSYTVCKPTREIHRRFFHYLLRSQLYIQIYESLSYGVRVGQWELRYHEFKAIKSVWPPLQEQILISSYLDKRTSQIGSLIEKIEQKIELLKEQRTSLINQCVTKGLNPDVEMKDSGVEWIGKIPVWWEVKRIKRISTVRRGASPRPIDDPKYFDTNGEWAWVRIADISASKKHLKSTTQTLSELGSSLSVKIEPGSIFLSIAGTVGKPIITKIKCCIHDGFVHFPNLRINPEYLYYIFVTGLPYRGLGKWGTQLNLNTDTVGEICIPIPRKEEKKYIVHYLNKKTSQIDSLIEKEAKRIELLKEYRQSLISNTVTGKIRVTEDMI